MTLGIHTVNVANPQLDWLRGVAPASVAGLFVQMHTADPGGAGTTSVSAVTTRRQATMNAASGGQITLASVSGNYAMTTTETISHLSIWDASTSGNVRWTVALTTPRPVVNGDTLVLSSLTLAYTPLMA